MIDTCPNCDADLELIKYHSNFDYAMAFQMDCPNCEALLNVEVEAEPTFVVTVESVVGIRFLEKNSGHK